MEEQWQCDEFCVHDTILAKMEQMKIPERKKPADSGIIQGLGR